MNEAREILDHVDLRVEGQRIAAITPTGEEARAEAPDRPRAKPGTVIDGANMVAIPGLINAHTHAAMVLLRGYADDMALEPWLEEMIWPTESRIVAEDVYWGTMLATVEMLKSGTTTLCDMYHFFESAARAMRDAKIRGVPSGVLLGFLPEPERRLRQAMDFCKEWNGAAEGRITVMLAPHALYTCSREILEKFVEAAADLGVKLHTHLAETEAEVRRVQQEYGRHPVEAMDEIGMFDVGLVAAHCVHVTDEHIEIFREKKVGVAHNPTSNMKLASGSAPVQKMLQRGVTVGVATDGAASNNNLSMVEEMHLAALLDKVFSKDPTAVSAYSALEMATRNGARALGLQDQVGQLKEGMKADIVLFDFDKPHLCPRHNVVSHLVYSAMGSDVDTVLVDGEILLHKGKLTQLDEQEIMARASEAARRITTAE
ncbi:MAG: amidohydrolase [Armatimonadetes bacterium]|nr:amidohydrolase [Armatimonadota bacterium]